MAVPTDPTVAGITDDAFLLVGVDDPTSTDDTNAQAWLQEILNDIYSRQFRDGNTRLKSLQSEFLDISTDNQRTLTLPEDFDEEISVQVYDSSSDNDDRGTAQSGANGSITLASAEDITQANAEGRTIIITGGTGVDQFRQITAYNTGTKVATVHSNWDTNPTSSSTYLIVTKTFLLEEAGILEFDEDTSVPTPGRPSEFAKYNRELIFNKPFDLSTYGIFVRYFMHTHQVNLTEGNTTRITRLLRDWRSILINGIAMKAALNKDDNKFQVFQRDYERGVTNMMVKEQTSGGVFERFTLWT